MYARTLLAVAAVAVSGAVPRCSAAQQRTVAILHHPALDSLRESGLRQPLLHVTANGTKVVSSRADSIVLKRSELLIKRTGDSLTLDRSGPRAHYDLPARIVAPAANGATASFTIAIDSTGLAYNPGEQAFVGTMYVGLDDSLHRNSVVSLTSPITVQITAADSRVHIIPGELKLRHTNVPYESVRVSGGATVPDTIRLTVHPTFGVKQSLLLRVDRPVLTLRSSPASIAGFGLEKARLTVSLPQALVTHALRIEIDAQRSRPVDGGVTVQPGAPVASTDIRSRGIGVDTIEARVSPFGTGRAAVRYTFPYLFILFAIAGGVAGGTVRVFRRKDSTVAHRTLVIGLGVGILTGLIVAVGAAIGINLTTYTLPSTYSEAAAFVFGAIGALAGIRRVESKAPSPPQPTPVP